MIRIGLDMMGGDYTPTEAIKGLIHYLNNCPLTVHVYVIGKQLQLLTALQQQPNHNYTIVPSTQVIEYTEHPTKAWKNKQDSSIVVGFNMLKAETIDAFISAGNTGAMLVGCHFSLKPLPGIIRPAIAAVCPKLNGTTGLLCDVGLNADCKPEQLAQFAALSNVLAKAIFNIESPKIGLLNIGEEEGKGNTLAQETYTLLKQNTALNFVGNIEGRDMFNDKADVIVCDGFTGNVVLKMAEELYEIAKQNGIDNPFFNRCNFETYGGSPILGVSKPVIIGHGISQHTAFTNMLKLAESMVATNVMATMETILIAE